MWKRIEKDISKTVLNLKVLGLKTIFPYSNLYIISVVYSLFKEGKRALSPTKKKKYRKCLVNSSSSEWQFVEVASKSLS